MPNRTMFHAEIIPVPNNDKSTFFFRLILVAPIIPMVIAIKAIERQAFFMAHPSKKTKSDPVAKKIHDSYFKESLPNVDRAQLAKLPERVNHPSHYNQGKYEVIDVIQDWGLDFTEGNVVKYVARSKHKENRVEDLKKARWYLDYLINQLEKE